MLEYPQAMALPTLNFIHAEEITSISRVGSVAVASLVVSLLLVPVYTKYAFRHQWWKRQRSNAVTGEQAPVFKKLHAEKHKRNIPTMGGLVPIAAITIVTVLFNL